MYLVPSALCPVFVRDGGTRRVPLPCHCVALPQNLAGEMLAKVQSVIEEERRIISQERARMEAEQQELAAKQRACVPRICGTWSAPPHSVRRGTHRTEFRSRWPLSSTVPCADYRAPRRIWTGRRRSSRRQPRGTVDSLALSKWRRSASSCRWIKSVVPLRPLVSGSGHFESARVRGIDLGPS